MAISKCHNLAHEYFQICFARSVAIQKSCSYLLFGISVITIKEAAKLPKDRKRIIEMLF